MSFQMNNDSLQLLQERGFRKIGKPEEAAIAGDKAKSLEKAHFEIFC